MIKRNRGNGEGRLEALGHLAVDTAKEISTFGLHGVFAQIDQLKEAKWDDLVPVGSLHREFNGNLVAAEEMYKGKTIMVEGEVESVDRSGFGSVQIYLSYRHGQRGVRCAVSSVGAKSEDLKNLQPGSWVRVHGHCEGKAPSGIVNMTDCIFMLVNR